MRRLSRRSERSERPRSVSSNWLGLFVEFFENPPIVSSPLNKSICTATFNHCCRGARTRKFCIFGKLVEAIVFNKRAVVNQLIAERKHVRIPLGQLALVQDSRRAPKHHKFVGRSTTASLSTLHTAEKDAARLLLRSRLCDGD